MSFKSVFRMSIWHSVGFSYGKRWGDLLVKNCELSVKDADSKSNFKL